MKRDPATTILPGTRGVELGTPNPARSHCPACDGSSYSDFYRQERVPVDSFRLLESRDEATHAPSGRLDLAVCGACGFVWNRSFDPAAQDYTAVFEETQWFSGRFLTFGRALAQRLVDRHQLRGKKVLEIGCGPGHFLALLCATGDVRGLGLDPFYTQKAGLSEIDGPNLEILPEYFSEAHASRVGNLVVCRHTLEHVQPVGDLLRLIRKTIGDRETAVFFEVPDMARILREAAFWQIYYEHCSYLSAGTMARLYRTAGFSVSDLYLDFEDQYVMIEGYPARTAPDTKRFSAEESVEQLLDSVGQFSATLERRLAHWREIFDASRRRRETVALWGGAPQAVAFQLALGIQDQVEYIVNINPVQQGKFAVGTGQQIVAPDFLTTLRPTRVVLMNAVYRGEIERSLDAMGLRCEILAV